jgi:hypothetical protein
MTDTRDPRDETGVGEIQDDYERRLTHAALAAHAAFARAERVARNEALRRLGRLGCGPATASLIVGDLRAAFLLKLSAIEKESEK